MNLKNIADTKIKAAEKQQETHDVANLLGYDVSELAKGKLKESKENMKQAKYGKEIFKAQNGTKYPVYDADGNISYYVDDKGNKIDDKTPPAKNASTKSTGKYKHISGEGYIDYNPIGEAGNAELWGSEENYKKNWMPKVDEALSDPKRADQIIAQLESYTGQDAKDVIAAIKAQRLELER